LTSIDDTAKLIALRKRILEPEQVCDCGHGKSDHHFRFRLTHPGTGWCGKRSCTCPQFRPRATLVAEQRER